MTSHRFWRRGWWATSLPTLYSTGISLGILLNICEEVSALLLFLCCIYVSGTVLSSWGSPGDILRFDFIIFDSTIPLTNYSPQTLSMCLGLSFMHILPEYIFLTSSCLMSLIPYETIFPDVISIWHPLYKEKHMLAIRGVMRILFLGNQFSCTILRNLHVHYLFEKMQKF